MTGRHSGVTAGKTWNKRSSDLIMIPRTRNFTLAVNRLSSFFSLSLHPMEIRPLSSLNKKPVTDYLKLFHNTAHELLMCQLHQSLPIRPST